MTNQWHVILYFDNEQAIHMSSKNHEESGYGLDLDLPTISLGRKMENSG